VSTVKYRIDIYTNCYFGRESKSRVNYDPEAMNGKSGYRFSEIKFPLHDHLTHTDNIPQRDGIH
jgi:hypothetical protein